MAKNWITKKQLSQLINAYSFKKNEFVLDEGQESGTYRYSSSRKDSGIHLTVSSWYNSIQAKTEGYKVSLSDENGIITCTDFYRPEGDSLILVMRNVPKEPRSDEYRETLKDIRQLEKENYALYHEKKRLQDEIDDLKSKLAKAKDISSLEKKIEKLSAENRELKKSLKACQKLTVVTRVKNERGAGRHKSPERAEAIKRLKQLIADDTSQDRILKELKISKRTFYRYKKELE